jgi:hypothetical protein
MHEQPPPHLPGTPQCLQQRPSEPATISQQELRRITAGNPMHKRFPPPPIEEVMAPLRRANRPLGLSIGECHEVLDAMRKSLGGQHSAHVHRRNGAVSRPVHAVAGRSGGASRTQTHGPVNRTAPVGNSHQSATDANSGRHHQANMEATLVQGLGSSGTRTMDSQQPVHRPREMQRVGAQRRIYRDPKFYTRHGRLDYNAISTYPFEDLESTPPTYPQNRIH